MPRSSEGLPTARLLMVIASLSPLFLLWAVRGIPAIPDFILIPSAAALIVLPNGVLLARFYRARRANDLHPKIASAAEDHRNHLLVYLFAVLLPLWTASMGDCREVIAGLGALAFVIFLFWHLNLHYMNLLFAVGGYHVFSITPPADDSETSDPAPFVLITWRSTVPLATTINAYRISNHVYWERKKT